MVDLRKKLADGLAKALAPAQDPPTPKYLEIRELLNDFAHQLQDLIGVGVTVTVDVGYFVSKGQEHRLAIRAPSLGFSDYILRAFIPLKGYPVELDVFEETDTICRNADDLVSALIGFTKKKHVQTQLTALRNANSK